MALLFIAIRSQAPSVCTSGTVSKIQMKMGTELVESEGTGGKGGRMSQCHFVQ